jgi:hypothetical protein
VRKAAPASAYEGADDRGADDWILRAFPSSQDQGVIPALAGVSRGSLLAWRQRVEEHDHWTDEACFDALDDVGSVQNLPAV